MSGNLTDLISMLTDHRFLAIAFISVFLGTVAAFVFVLEFCRYWNGRTSFAFIRFVFI